MPEIERNEVAEGFSDTAKGYDDAVRFTIAGAERLIAAIPARIYNDVLDVGCGTGFSATAMVERFGSSRITWVDPASGMLDAFREKLAAFPLARSISARRTSLPCLADDRFDAAVCSMAFHWFTEKPAAT